jgi:hypothetical protein
MLRRWMSIAWILLITLHMTSQVYACPVCGVGRDGTTSAYLMTAALMSLVPLVMAGAIVYYLVRQAKHDSGRSPERPFHRQSWRKPVPSRSTGSGPVMPT